AGGASRASPAAARTLPGFARGHRGTATASATVAASPQRSARHTRTRTDGTTPRPHGLRIVGAFRHTWARCRAVPSVDLASTSTVFVLVRAFQTHVHQYGVESCKRAGRSAFLACFCNVFESRWGYFKLPAHSPEPLRLASKGNAQGNTWG